MRLRQMSVATLSAFLLMAGLISASGAATAAASHATAIPAFCTGGGPIPATAVSSPVDLSTCPIQGRLLVSSDGRAGVHVPPPGQTVTNDSLTTRGEYELTAVNANGRLTVRASYTSGRAAARPHPAVRPETDPACSEDAFHFEGGDWGSSTDKWYLNEGTIASRTNLDVSTAVSNIRQGNTNMTTGANNCGFTREPNAHGAFQGDTSRFANINSDANCTSNFPDGQNTLSFGPMSSLVYNQNTHSGVIGVTCIDFNTTTGRMIEADIYFGSNVDLVNSLPANCQFANDLQTLATHEWGHAYGLDHETSGRDEVMYPSRPSCTLRRKLGKGDWDAMTSLYGFR